MARPDWEPWRHETCRSSDKRFTIVETTTGYTVADHRTGQVERTTIIEKAQWWARRQRVLDPNGQGVTRGWP